MNELLWTLLIYSPLIVLAGVILYTSLFHSTQKKP